MNRAIVYFIFHCRISFRLLSTWEMTFLMKLTLTLEVKYGRIPVVYVGERKKIHE